MKSQTYSNCLLICFTLSKATAIWWCPDASLFWSWIGIQLTHSTEAEWWLAWACSGSEEEENVKSLQHTDAQMPESTIWKGQLSLWVSCFFCVLPILIN